MTLINDYKLMIMIILMVRLGVQFINKTNCLIINVNIYNAIP